MGAEVCAAIAKSVPRSWWVEAGIHEQYVRVPVGASVAAGCLGTDLCGLPWPPGPPTTTNTHNHLQSRSTNDKNRMINKITYWFKNKMTYSYEVLNMRGKSANNSSSGFHKQVEKSSKLIRNWVWNVSWVGAFGCTFPWDDLERPKNETWACLGGPLDFVGVPKSITNAWN